MGAINEKKLNIKSSESKLELKLREEFFELYKKIPYQMIKFYLT